MFSLNFQQISLVSDTYEIFNAAVVIDSVSLTAMAEKTNVREVPQLSKRQLSY